MRNEQPPVAIAVAGDDVSPRKTAPIPPLPCRRAAAPAPFFVESLDAASAQHHVAAWEDLAARGLEPNPFMAPGFCLPAARHLAPSSSLTVLLVWDRQADGSPRLVAVCPLVRATPPLWPVAGVWFHDLAALGAPLLDRHVARAAFLAIVAWIARHRPMRAALLMTAIHRDGPTAQMLEEIGVRTGRRVAFLDERRRAILAGPGGAQAAGPALAPPRPSRERLRQRRRLSERGALRYRSASDPEDVMAALERFLILEGQGWKGEAGTALVSSAPRAAFVRAMGERMAAHGRIRIDSLLLDDRPIAMGIILASQDRHYFWKTAFAEDLAALSPGVQFVLDLTQAQLARRDLGFTDSCAMPDHPMIDRLWPGRLTIADAVIEINDAAGWRFSLALKLERARRNGRARLKRLYKVLRATLAHAKD